MRTLRVRTLTATLVLAAALAACGKDDRAPTTGGPSTPPASPGPAAPAAQALDASSPKALAESIFAIAKSGDLALLVPVADPVDADGDAKDVAGVAKAPADRQADFRKHFGTGKVSGEVKVEGDRASVPILFGPDGTRPETLEMVKRGERWHLQSF
jgi:hypothetical protein